MNQQNEQLTEVLSRLDLALASFASTIDGFSSITAGLQPRSVISSQALQILQQFESTGASKALEIHVDDQVVLHTLDGEGGEMEIPDPRFLDDDLRQMQDLGLLNLSYNQNRNRIFHYTRAASALVKSAK